MAFMNKMRDSMPVVFAGLAGIFLLMIIFQWGGQGTLFRGNQDGETLALVNGRKVTTKDYDRILLLVQNNMKAQGKKTELTETEQQQAQDQAWDETMNDAIRRNSMEQLGIVVTDQEIRDRIFEDPPEGLRRQFTDSTGVFHQKEMIQVLRDKKYDSVVRNQIEAPMREDLMRQKWQAAMLSMVRITNSELRDRFDNEHSKANVQIIRISPQQPARSYFSQVTDAEVKSYYDAHAEQYKQDETRKFQFVIFNQSATARDSAVIRDRIQALKSRLAQIPLDQIDSEAKEMAADYSEQPYQPSHLMTPAEWTGTPQLENAKVGDVIVTNGPQLQVVRVLGEVDTGLQFFHTRHILIGFGQPANKDSAKTLAEKIYTDLKSGANFAALAQKYSSDPGSGSRGGDLGWAGPGQFVKPFEDVASKAPMNQVQPPVESDFGYHIIEVLSRTSRKLKVVAIPLAIKPSSQTTRMISQQANLFREQAEKNGFDPAAKAGSYHVVNDVPPLLKKEQPIFGSKTFMAWLFNASKNEISPVMNVAAIHSTVVAQLTDINPAGPKPLDEVKQQIKTQLATKKSVDAMAAKANQIRSQLAPGDDLSKVNTSGDTSLRPFTVSMGPGESVNPIGTEYAINTLVYRMKPGEISQPIEGDRAYYIAKLLSISPATDQAFQQQKPTLINTLLREKQQRFMQEWIDNERNNATIVDYRNQTK